MINDTSKRFYRTNARGGLSGLIGHVTCSYVELVEALGLPNVKMSGDKKTSMGWRICDGVVNRVCMIYAYKATRDYDSGLPTRAAFKRLPSHEWSVSGSNTDLDALGAFLSANAGRTVNITK